MGKRLERCEIARHPQPHLARGTRWQKNNGFSIASVKRKLNTIQSSHPTVSPFRAGLRMINTKLLNNWRLKGVKQPLPWTLPTVHSLQINRFKSFLYMWSDPSPCKAFSPDSMRFMCVRRWECVSWEPRDIVSCTCHQHAVVSLLIEEGRNDRGRFVYMKKNRLCVIQILFRFQGQLWKEQTWES